MRYQVDLARAALRLPHKVSQVALLGDLEAWIRIEFLGAAAIMGVLSALEEPKSSEALAGQLGFAETDLLTSFLDVGAALGELRYRDGRWSLRGRRARALADPDVDGLSGMLEEAVSYDADVYRALRRRRNGEPPGDYLAESAEIVARASRLAEVVLSPLVRDLARGYRPSRTLDIGCGSGTYLRAVVETSNTGTAVGIDIQPEVVAAARRNLATWEIADRCVVYQADVRRMPTELAGPWDLVLLLQNVYYFHPDERPALFAKLRSLAPSGVVAVATTVAGTGDPLGAHLDIVLRSTEGNYPLPVSGDVTDALRGAGFTRIVERRLAPRQPIRAFVAS